ncbi:hypothetical protein WR25_22305 [Diploscapter pachys]|uniref:Uncharacterized protein n=1 Tax=Diploscapter pachys TaxID=2018661 RepID=A0A2A2JTZ7_9BILA|nr:hypothetical protein WR25_22305 [Diploscapter pachys]
MTKQQEGKQLEEKKLQLQKENEQIKAELVIELDEVKKKNARLREENEKKIKAKKEAEQKQVKASKEPTPRRVSFEEEEEEDTEVMVPIEQNNDHSPSSAVSDALPSHPTSRRSSTSKNRFELDMLVDLMEADDSMIDSRTDEDEFNFTVSFIPERVKHNNDKDKGENKGSKDSSQGKEKKKVPATRRRDSSFRPQNQITPDYNVFRAGANPLFTSTPHRSRVSNFFDPKSLNRMPTVRGIATTSTSRRSRPRK